MNTFSHISKVRLATCHSLLQTLLNAVLPLRDISVLCGFRGQVAQNTAVANRASKTPWPHSKHNKQPSLAVDVDVYPRPKDAKEHTQQLIELAEIIKSKAKELNIKIRWGGDWDGDGDMNDQTFNDLYHWELHA